ncbi:ATP-binding protein [Nonomuraea bangladeshensis]|uniref:ATP-binding protein n=1 Tax=Nonomuraea bangladeshensis TaxID=404385 RepID=UPI0031D015F5
MDNRNQHAILDQTSRSCDQQPRVAEFPDLAPGLVMSTFRSSQLWSGMAWRRAFAGRADQSAPARQMVQQLLAGTGRADDARWVTAELVSNALRHTRSGQAQGFFVVEVLRGTDVVRIVVYDLGGGCVPDFVRRPGSVPETAEYGRGLLGVAELAIRMGVAGDASTGHAVWADLALNSETACVPRKSDAVRQSPAVGAVDRATACHDGAPVEGIAGGISGHHSVGLSDVLMAAGSEPCSASGKEVAGLGPRWGLWEAS